MRQASHYVRQWPGTRDFESSRKGKHYLCQSV
nr:MAG TPA: hypothetical protein [Caudoviricetes sp.]